MTLISDRECMYGTQLAVHELVCCDYYVCKLPIETKAKGFEFYNVCQKDNHGRLTRSEAHIKKGFAARR